MDYGAGTYGEVEYGGSSTESTSEPSATFGRATRSSTARPLTPLVGALIVPLGRAVRTSTPHVLTSVQTAPLDYYPDEVMADGALLYWRLEELGNAVDHSGFGRHGVFANWASGADGATFYQGELVPGILNDGRRFIESEVAYSDPDTYAQTVDFTLEMWFNLRTYDPTSGHTLVNVGYQKQIGIRHATNGTDYIYAYAGGGNGGQGTQYDVSPLSAIDDGGWHHLVLTRSGASVRFYVDGVQTYATDAAQATTASTSSTTYTGAWEYNVDAPAYDEIAYYNHALTPTQVTRHYRSATELGAPPLHRTIPVGRVTSIRLTQPIRAAQDQTVQIGRTSRTSTPSALASIAGPPPGTPQILGIGRATTTSIARTLAAQLRFPQAIVVGRAVRTSIAKTLTYSSGVIYEDTFERPDAASLGVPDVGGPYTYRAGSSNSWSIAGGSAGQAGTGHAQVTFPGAIDFDLELVLRQAGTDMGLMFRWVDVNNYWLVRWAAGSELSLVRQSGSVATVQGVARTGYLGADNTIRVVADGKIISVSLNGRPIWILEDQFQRTATLGYRGLSDNGASRIERVALKQLVPSTPPLVDVMDVELAMILATGNDQAFVYKGRDARLADEGAMA